MTNSNDSGIISEAEMGLLLQGLIFLLETQIPTVFFFFFFKVWFGYTGS